MRINQSISIHNNFTPQQQTYKPLRNNIKDSVSFSSRAKRITSLIEFNDGIVMSDFEKLGTMLDLARQARRETVEIPFRKPAGRIKRFMGKINPLGCRDKAPHIDRELEYQYEEKGRRNFVKMNFDFFNRLRSSEEATRIPGHRKFLDEMTQITSSISHKIGSDVDMEIAYRLSLAGNKNGAVEFIRTHSDFFAGMKDVLATKETLTRKVNVKPSPPVEPEVKRPPVLEEERPPIKPEPVKVEPPKFDGEKAMAEYRELVKKQKPFSSTMTEEEKKLWHKQDDELRKRRIALETNNVSFIERKAFSTDPTKDVDAKRKYLAANVDRGRTNEASRQDYLEMFDKYGGRYWRNKYGETLPAHVVWNDKETEFIYRSLNDLGRVMSEDSSDNAIKKYIDIIDRLAQRDPKGMRDAVSIAFVFRETAQNMSKETALKFISVLKRTSFQQRDGYSVETALEKTSFKDDSKVQAALADYKKFLEDQNFPYQDRTRND